jgi:lipoteichoic acid synthase
MNGDGVRLAHLPRRKYDAPPARSSHSPTTKASHLLSLLFRAGRLSPVRMQTSAPFTLEAEVTHPNRRSRILHVAPIAATVLILWVKQICLSLSLQRIWLDESTGRWIATHLEMFGATLATSLIVLAPVALVRSSVRRYVLALVVDLLLTAILLADDISVRFYGTVFEYGNFATPEMLEAAAASVVRSLESWHLLYLVDLLAGIAALPLFVRACRRAPSRASRRGFVAAACMLAVGLALLVPAVRRAARDDAGGVAFENLEREVCGVMGVIPYHVYALSIYFRAPAPASAEEIAHIRAFVDGRRASAPASPLSGAARGKNLIIISAESLQAFPIGLEIGGQPVAPRLAEFARESLRFSNCFDQTHLGTTSDAEFLALHSLHPAPKGFAVYAHVGNRFHGLPAALADRGYSTLAACAAPGSFWNMSVAHPHYGFRQNYFEEAYGPGDRIGPWLADRDFFVQSIPFLISQKRPFLALLTTSSNHHPFNLPARYRALALGDLEGTLLGDYLHSVHYFDQAFGALVDGLRDAELLDETVIALYGDHQGFLGDPPEIARLLGLDAQNELDRFLTRKRIPFLVRLPRGEGARDFTAPAGEIDIAPTLLSLLGVVDARTVMLGRDLTADGPALVAFRNGSFVSDEHCLINRLGSSSDRSCYDLATGARIDCGLLERERRQALGRLAMSDAILKNDLVPSLAGVPEK